MKPIDEQILRENYIKHLNIILAALEGVPVVDAIGILKISKKILMRETPVCSPGSTVYIPKAESRRWND